MTRILYWNIEKFSVNKFWEVNEKRDRAGAIIGGQFTQSSVDHLSYFLRAFDNAFPNGTPANTARTPEIVVIVELQSGKTGRGNLVTGRGPEVTQLMVNLIRRWTGNNNWMAVPPLYTGPREGVIVLYDSTVLIFTGPDLWPGGIGPAASPPPGPLRRSPVGPPPASPYPQDWNPYIRTGVLSRAIPDGALYNTNRWENQMAARVAGFTSSGGAGLVPQPAGMPALRAAMDGELGPRTPYMVTFFRPAPAENITLFAIHSPANISLAHDYMTALVCTQEIANAPVGNERKVVVGDFNFNLFTNAGAVPQRYQYFTQLAYALGIAPVPLGGASPAPTLGYFEYFATHLTGPTGAFNWSYLTEPYYYPGYGYFSSSDSCIDNIFVRGGALANTTILNPVVGSPHNVQPAGGPPAWLTPAMRGHFPMDCLCSCYNPPDPLPLWQAPQFAPGMRQVFRSWNNFWRIRSTSDHLPIIADF